MLQFHFLVSVRIADSKLDDDMMAQDEERRARGERGEEGMEAWQGGGGEAEERGGAYGSFSAAFSFSLEDFLSLSACTLTATKVKVMFEHLKISSL